MYNIHQVIYTRIIITGTTNCDADYSHYHINVFCRLNPDYIELFNNDDSR